MRLNNFITSDGKFLVTELIDFFDDELLNYQKFPNDYLEFLEHIFSNKKYFRTNNLWKVLHMLTTECLDKRQFHYLSLVLSKNFRFYEEYMLCDMCCDFIARCCEADYAINLFNKMKKEQLDPMHIKCIILGLNIMLTHADKKSLLHKRIKSFISKIAEPGRSG